MFEAFRRFFTTPNKDKQELQPEVPKSEEELSIAACAILLEVAHADGKMDKCEEERIIQTVKERFLLPDEAAKNLLLLAEEHRANRLDLFEFTNRINQDCSFEEKIKIMETIWRVIYADGRLDKYEDYLVHRLAKLLRLTHRQLIDAKVKILHDK